MVALTVLAEEFVANTKKCHKSNITTLHYDVRRCIYVVLTPEMISLDNPITTILHYFCVNL